MHWIEQDGVKLPKRLGGHPALDFCNTWAGWSEHPPEPARSAARPDPMREWLADYDTFAAWARYAEIVDEQQLAELRSESAEHPRRAAHVLVRAWRLRSSVHAAVRDPADSVALAEVGDVARRAAAVAEMVPDTGCARWVIPAGTGLELPLLAVARAAADLLTSPDVRAVHACPGVDCGWMFLDKRGRRRWCDMAVCGNRAKVAAHARRAKERAAASSR